MSGQIPKAMFHAIDTRYNLSELPQQLTPDIRSRIEQQAQSVACLVHQKSFITTGNQYHISSKVPTLAHKFQSNDEEFTRAHSSEEKRPPVQEEARLKYDGPFKDELSLADGTAFLVGKQLILTAAHCICDEISQDVDKEKIRDYRVLFGFQTDSSGQVRTTFDAKDVYRIESVYKRRFTREEPDTPHTADWAILKLEREVEGRVPLRLDSMQALPLNTPLYMLGHPFGLPLKLALSGEVQKANHPDFFGANIDAYTGNSGSPLFVHDSGKLVGMHLRGIKDYVRDGNKIRIRTVSEREIENREASYETCHKIASIDLVKTVLTSSFKMTHSHFFGRTKHLADLKTHLTEPSPSTRVQVLYGLSGVGKSELATAFANQNIEAFSFIWTISCVTEEEQFNGYQSLATRLAIPLGNKEDLPSLIHKVHRELEQNTSKPWLLFFENLQTFPALPSRGGSVIITSYRNLGIPQVGVVPTEIEPEEAMKLLLDVIRKLNKDMKFLTCKGAVVATEVLPLEPEEALKLLQDVTGQPIEDCQKLLECVGCYPILVGQVVAYIKQNPDMKIAEYLACLKQNASLEASFSLTLTRLSPLAKEWLFLCSRLNATHIPLSYLKVWLNLESRSEDPTEIIAELEAYGLFRYNAKEEAFSVHLEFQRILKALAPRSTAAQVASLLTIVGEDWDEDGANNLAKTMQKLTVWFSHTESLFESTREDQEWCNDPKLANNIGSCYFSRKNYSKALKMYGEALKIQRAILEENDPNVAICLNNIGLCYYFQGNYIEALKMHNETLKIYKAALGENDPTLAICLSNVGNCYYAQDNYNEALKMFREALKIERATLGENHPNVATSLSDIGNCYASQENYTEALKMYDEALKIFQTVLGDYDPKIVAAVLRRIDRCKARLDEQHQKQRENQSNNGRCVVS
jgi:tetratricopeptide (TPR) repeat protein/V8-like Glu-specific endopeptidase